MTLTLDQARADFATIGTTARPPSRRRWQVLDDALYRGVLLPPRDWASAEAREYVRTNYLAGQAPSVEALLRTPAVLRAAVFGWITTNEWAELGITPESVRQEVSQLSLERQRRLLGPETIDVAGQRYTVLRMDASIWQIRWLRQIGCLDLLDRELWVETLRAHQIHRDRPLPEGRNPDLDRKLWDGLFALVGEDPIRETWEALVILEALGALDAIDRKACADGLLRYHLGRGLFLPPDPNAELFARLDRTPKYVSTMIIWGDARTTFAAREALRIVGALDRVKDLADWEFRAMLLSPRPTSKDPQKPRIPEWNEIEAAILKDRFATGG